MLNINNNNSKLIIEDNINENIESPEYSKRYNKGHCHFKLDAKEVDNVEDNLNVVNNDILNLNKYKSNNKFNSSISTNKIGESSNNIGTKFTSGKNISENFNENNIVNPTTRSKITLSTSRNNLYTVNFNIHNINEYNIKSLVKKKVYTYNDLSLCHTKLQLIIDKRGFFDYLWSELKIKHELMCIFYVHSINDSFNKRISTLFIDISMSMFMNAFFFSDEYISERGNYKNNLSNLNDYNSVWYTISDEFWRLLWPAFIAMSIMCFLQIMLIIPNSVKNNINKYLLKGHKYFIRQAM